MVQATKGGVVEEIMLRWTEMFCDRRPLERLVFPIISVAVHPLVHMITCFANILLSTLGACQIKYDGCPCPYMLKHFFYTTMKALRRNLDIQRRGPKVYKLVQDDTRKTFDLFHGMVKLCPSWSCMAFADEQKLFLSGERIVAHGPLVLLFLNFQQIHYTAWECV